MAVLVDGCPDREKGEKMSAKPTKATKKALLIAQEIKLAKALAGNDKKVRDKALKSLKKWFQNPVGKS